MKTLSISITNGSISFDDNKLKDTINFLCHNSHIYINKLNKEQLYHFNYFKDVLKKSSGNATIMSNISNAIKKKYNDSSNKAYKYGTIGAYLYGCLSDTNCSDNMCTAACITGFKPEDLPGYNDCEKNVILISEKNKYSIIKRNETSPVCWIIILEEAYCSEDFKKLFNKQIKQEFNKLKIKKYNCIIMIDTKNYKKIHDTDIDFVDTNINSNNNNSQGWGFVLGLFIVLLCLGIVALLGALIFMFLYSKDDANKL